jgi:hypothetical protein
MKSLLLAVLISTVAATSMAEPFNPSAKVLVGIGEPISNDINKEWGDVSPYTVFVSGRLSLPSVSPVQLSAGLNAPYGFEMTALFNIIHLPNFALHFDSGVFISTFGKSISVPSVSRNVDIVFGAGFDYKMSKNLWVFGGYKVYMPDPTRIPKNYGVYAFPIYNEALKEGNAYLAIGYEF